MPPDPRGPMISNAPRRAPAVSDTMSVIISGGSSSMTATWRLAMWTFALMLTALAPQAAPAAAAPLSTDQQIASAVLAAPEERRADATVLGYDASGALVTLRKGTGDLICLADDPKDADFDVACYQKDLEPFMARGRELRAKGIADK